MNQQPLITKGVAYFKWAEHGWSETYWFPHQNLNAALLDFSKFIPYRAAILAKDVSITHARVSFPGLAREAIAMGGVPFDGGQFLSPVPGVTDKDQERVEHVNNAISYRCQAIDNAAVQGGVGTSVRLFRGVADQYINQMQAWSDFRGGDAAPWTPPAALTFGASNTVYVNKFFKALGFYTVFGRRVKAPVGPNIWEWAPWTSIQYYRASSRKTGRPFGLRRGAARISS